MSQNRQPNFITDAPEAASEPIAFNLQEFFPYLVRIFYRDVTATVASIYDTEFGMTPAEWRSMMVIGPDRQLTAQDIVARSSMDKVIVSRTLARMKQNGWIETRANAGDGRSKLISLTNSGKTIYAQLIPQALKVEEKLLGGISEEQKNQFISIMAKISSSRRQL